MSSRVRSHIRGNVVAYLALFLVLTGGTAQALSGSNTVFTDDIVDGHVRHADLAKNSVGTVNIADGRVLTPDLAAGSVRSGKIADGQVKNPDLAPSSVATGKIADGQVKNPDLAPSSVATGKIADGQVKGVDVDESTLGTVPNAARVDGSSVRAIFERVSANDNQPLVSLGGLDVSLDCDATSDAGLRLDFGQTPTAYRLTRINAANAVNTTEEANRTGGSLLTGASELFLLSAASGGKALNAQIQTWDAGTNALGQPQCLHSGFVMVEG